VYICVWVGGGRTFICASGPSPPVWHMVACAWDAAVVWCGVRCMMHTSAHYPYMCFLQVPTAFFYLITACWFFELVSSAD
jgi:hypothetical protein